MWIFKYFLKLEMVLIPKDIQKNLYHFHGHTDIVYNYVVTNELNHEINRHWRFFLQRIIWKKNRAVHDSGLIFLKSCFIYWQSRMNSILIVKLRFWTFHMLAINNPLFYNSFQNNSLQQLFWESWRQVPSSILQMMFNNQTPY